MPRKKRDYEILTIQRKSQVRRREIRAALVARRPRLDGDPAIAVYRREREAGQLRLAPLLDAAKQQLARVLADLEQHGRGGRPRKSKGVCAAVSSGSPTRGDQG
jgi:hypothetical protein